ncbi:hypothetical protein QJS04_geneDACA011862 [Acorus gramineus]|uniref:Uncharacterized protein n=1 Tax=Acorus gramineus TaxID=55184 RepID=A0AAV9AG52_ACOGR|nr:hypothetical protein QJS04_geneDACA011862 [Acorus gramineus]
MGGQDEATSNPSQVNPTRRTPGPKEKTKTEPKSYFKKISGPTANISNFITNLPPPPPTIFQTPEAPTTFRPPQNPFPLKQPLIFPLFTTQPLLIFPRQKRLLNPQWHFRNSQFRESPPRVASFNGPCRLRESLIFLFSFALRKRDEREWKGTEERRRSWRGGADTLASSSRSRS